MGFSMGLANNKLQLIRSTTATGTQWQQQQQQQQQTGVGGGVSRALQTCVCLWTLINAFEAFMQMAGNNLSPIQDATAAATAAATIAMDTTTTTATTATIIKPSIQALQYAKVLFISVTPTQLALSGRGHTFSRKVFFCCCCFCFLLCAFILFRAVAGGFVWFTCAELILLLLHLI